MVYQFILPALFIALFQVLPGALLSFAFFRKLSIGVFSKAMLGALVGLILPAIFGLLENLIFGAKYSFTVVLANDLLLWAIAVVALYLRGMLSFKLFNGFLSDKFSQASSMPYLEATLRYGGLLVLLAILVLSFHARYSTSASYNFFEFDPIYYDHLSEILLTQGQFPAHSYEVYWPLGRDIRGYPIVHYITVGWMHAATALGGLEPTKHFIVAVSQLYPPLLAMFMCFLAWLMFKELFSEIVGLVAAAVFAFMPQLIKKLAAGVSELQPFGLFSVVFIFAAYALYLKHRDLRFAALAALGVFAAVIGSAQSIWPLLVIAVAPIVTSFLDFRNKQLDWKAVAGQGIILAGGLLGGIALQAFEGASILLVPNSVFFLGGSFFVYAVLWLYQEYVLSRVPVAEEKQRSIVPIAVLMVALIAVAFVPVLNAKVIGYIVSTTQFAVASAALTQTVQEENATTPQFYPSSFGSINPDFMLPILFLLICAEPVFNFFKKNRFYGIAALAIVLLVTVFNPLLDSFLKVLVKSGAFGNVASLTDFISSSDVFLFTVVSILLLFADSFANGTDNRLLIFLAFAVFPVSYIGIRKLKFIVHLGVSLALAVPLLLGQGKKAIDYFQSFLSNESDKKMLFHSSTAIILLIGLLVSFSLANTLPASMNELGATRIPQDWIDAYAWMASNPNMTEQHCVAEYGYDCRVLSWWDYGHWTTFFGGKKSVLDPGNAYAAFDQEVAKSYVDGNYSDLKYTVNYHQATHILVDSDLIGKWGALVFLGGSCSKKESPICFDKPPIDFRAGTGKSQYEAQHYFEYLQPAGTCPQGISPVSLPAYRSQLTGATYCLAPHQLLLLTQSGLDSSYKRNYKLVGRDAVDTANIEQNTSYIFNFGDTLLNVNPDLSYSGLNNTVINAAYTRMYFFEHLPGVELAYRSPNSQVKIFKITKGGPLLP